MYKVSPDLQSQLRRSIIQELCDAGMKREDATIVIEMAEHATMEAANAIERVAESCSTHLRFNVYIMAYKMTQYTSKLVLDDITEMVLGSR